MTEKNETPRKFRFLVFSRNYIVADFRKSFDQVSDRFEFAYVTDGASSIASNTRATFYDALNKGSRSSELDPADIDEIASRCRLLRNITRPQAEKLLHAMAIALAHQIDIFKPDALISQMVDEYVSHVFAILAKKRGLGYLGYCAGYFPGTSLLLADAHGRPYSWRKAGKAEIDAQLAKISGTSFRQTYNLGASYGFARHIKSMLRYRIKLLWFALRGWAEGDRWNLHYRVTPYIAERRRLGDYPDASMFSRNWREQLHGLKKQRPDAKIFYLPLSYFPESTIDYWVLDKRMIDYTAMILRIVETLGREHIVIVKEHLHMMGARDASFLRALNAVPGVISVPPLELSNMVVAECDLVLLGSGSPGLEATLRGKPVATFCDTSYWFAPAGASFVHLDQIESWPKQLEAAIAAYQPLGADGQGRFLAACLTASTRTVESQTIWPVLHPDDLVELLPDLAARPAI